MKFFKKFSKTSKRNQLAKVTADFVSIHGDNLELDEFGILTQEDIDKEFQAIDTLSKNFYKQFRACKTQEAIEKKLQKFFVEKKYAKLGVKFSNQEIIKQIFMLDLEDKESCILLAMYIYAEFSPYLTRISVTKHFENCFKLSGPSNGTA